MYWNDWDDQKAYMAIFTTIACLFLAASWLYFMAGMATNSIAFAGLGGAAAYVVRKVSEW